MNAYLESPNYTVTPDGFLICTKIEPDDDADAPWDNSDCHGPVRTSSRDDKRPGEVIIGEYRGCRHYYDFQAAVAQARRDGWGCKRPTTTKGETAHYAALEDMQYLRRWIDGDWTYCGVVVELLAMPGGYDPDEDEPDDFTPAETASLWGVEYDPASSETDDYLCEIVHELTDEMLCAYRAAEAA